MPSKKVKLRTASDVISRLKWESSTTTTIPDPDLVMVGYTDRIDGPMEKPVKDFTSASHGGDIPEHRILYFRLASDELPLAKQVLWEKAGRVDRIFQSGAGPDAPIAEETLQAVRDAIATMKRKEIEREERRKERAKQRERRARKRAAGRTNLQETTGDDQSSIEQSRFHWHETPWFVYQDAEWTLGSSEMENEQDEENEEKVHDIVVVTWNVLFDLFDDGLESEDYGLDDHQHLSEERWKLLSAMLSQAKPDLISLQEVTPAFVRVLLDSAWVRDDFACSASPANTDSVNPSGVLLLWRRSTMSPFRPDCALFQCSDYGRNRSMMAVMKSKMGNSDIVIFAATHLPANKAKEESPAQTVSRKLARKRELSSILGEIERLQKQVCSDSHSSSTTSHVNKNVTPIIAGDFNCEDDELCDDYFAHSAPQNITSGTATLYRDCWSLVHGEDGGWTFDPTQNARAGRSSRLVGGKGEPRRIDRVFAGPTSQITGKIRLRDSHQLVPVTADLLGLGSETSSPPSDHYGVRVEMFKERTRRSEVNVARSLWAANVPASPHYMVALILDSENHADLKRKYDTESSLPLLHVTLLHGFVEADIGCLDLAKSVVGDAIKDAYSSMTSPASLQFSGELSLFEHRASCTVVAQPNEAGQEQKWLDTMYSALRNRFMQCNEQEKHSASGWKPHVTLGVVGSSSAARELIANWKDQASWSPSGETMALRSIDILKRGPAGLFQTIACFPINSTRLPAPTTIDSFLSDAGSSMSRFTVERANAVLWRIERACRSVTAGLSVEARIYDCGSIQLGAALHRLSDVDAVIKIQPKEGGGDTMNIAGTLNGTFMQNLFTAIKDDMPCIQGRLRPIARGNSAVLTIQVPDLPSIDLSLCICDTKGSPIDDASHICWNSYRDGEHILATLVQVFGISFLEVFQGALRIIKLWAHNRDVYGAATGFLGGGGWALWLAHYALREVKTESFDQVSPVEASLQLAVDFFTKAAKHDPDSPISLSLDSSIDRDMHHPGTLAVLPPCSDGDFGRSMTRSTTDATLSELKRASTLHLSDSIKPRSARAFISEYQQILAIELYQQSQEEEAIEMAELKALGSTNFLALLILLEKKINYDLLRPKSKPLRIGREWNTCGPGTEIGFVWVIGLTGDEDLLGQQIESDIQSQLIMHAVRLRLQVLTYEEAMQRIVV